MNLEMFRHIFLIKSEPGMIADKNGKLVQVNYAFCQEFGYDLDYWHSTFFHELACDNKQSKQFFDKALKDSKKMIERIQLRNSKNQNWPYNLSLAVYDEYVIGSIEKVESYRVDERLTYFETIFNSIQSIIYYRDNENRFIQVNQRFLDIVGLAKEEVIGKNIFDVFPGQASGYLRDDIEVMVTKKTKRNIIETFQTKEGLKWFTTDKMPYFNENGEVKGIIGFSVDITVIKNVEKALKESEDKYRTVAETTLAGIFIVDEYDKIYFTNPALSRMTGYSSDELNGMFVEQLFLNSNIDDCLSISPINEKETPSHCEKQIQSKSGTVNHVLMSASYIRLEGFENLCKLAVLVDITDRKRAEEKLNQQKIELQQHLSELRQIAYVSSHDLKEPLRMITSFVQLLEKRYRDKIDEEGSEYIQYVVEGVQRMQFLLNDLLIYSQISSKSIEFKKFEMKPMIEHVKDNLSHAIHETQANIYVNNMPLIEGDEKLLESLFSHLIENAIKYRGHKQPEISIKAKRMKAEWKFSISDNGIGIEKKYADRVFDIFQRLHTREKYQGNGIGLSICKKVIEKHGGKIWFDSEKDKGTTFYFTLPMHTNDTNMIKIEHLEAEYA